MIDNSTVSGLDYRSLGCRKRSDRLSETLPASFHLLETNSSLFQYWPRYRVGASECAKAAFTLGYKFFVIGPMLLCYASHDLKLDYDGQLIKSDCPSLSYYAIGRNFFLYELISQIGRFTWLQQLTVQNGEKTGI